MTYRELARLLSKVVTVLTLTAVCPLTVRAQGPLPEAPSSSAAAEPGAIVMPGTAEREHRFFDKWNVALFAGSAALAAGDFAVTRANLQSNGQELNPMVRIFGRSTAGLAVNFAGETAGSVAISYFLHKTGHHKLERVASVVNIGLSGGAVTYSLMHR
jgi:hypothetical protein